MGKIEQGHIKWENTRALFGALASADAEAVSRAELVAETGLSLMTVGKIVDNLDAAGVVQQVKDERVLAGRTARLVTLDSAQHMLVLDLTGRDYRLSVLDLRCRVVEETFYRYDDNLLCGENLTLFLSNLPMYLRHPADPARCMGVGVLLPGSYDATADRMLGIEQPVNVPLNPRRVLSRLLPGGPLTIISDTHAAVLAASVGMEQADNLLWLSLDQPISGAAVMGGRPMLGANGCGGRFGEVTVGTNFTLREAMLTLSDSAERGAAVAVALYSLISALDPAEVHLESREKIDDRFLASMHERLERLSATRTLSLPPITIASREIAAPVLGLAAKMRENWLFDRLGR